MYKLYDLNMKHIPFPVGVMPLDFLVGSTSKRRETETIPGRTGVMDYGFDYESRPVTINMLLTAYDRIDFQLLRNAIYNLFNTHDKLYIADDLLPSRVLKVAVDETYIPNKFNHTDAEVTINCRTLDSLFWETTYTTLELHDSGFDATEEKYGLVDNIDDEKVQYRFTENQFTVYNAGNVTIEPESMYLNITLGMLVTDDVFRLTNKTTGETFEWQKPVNGRNIYIRGMNIHEGTAYNGFRDTNRRFISLVPGDNDFEVSGGTFSQISFDFKYQYK